MLALVTCNRGQVTGDTRPVKPRYILYLFFCFISAILSAHIERFIVSHMHDHFVWILIVTCSKISGYCMKPAVGWRKLIYVIYWLNWICEKKLVAYLGSKYYINFKYQFGVDWSSPGIKIYLYYIKHKIVLCMFVMLTVHPWIIKQCGLLTNEIKC